MKKYVSKNGCLYEIRGDNFIQVRIHNREEAKELAKVIRQTKKFDSVRIVPRQKSEKIVNNGTSFKKVGGYYRWFIIEAYPTERK